MDNIFFSNNRRRLADALNGGLIILGGYTRLQRSNDAAHPFTQEANFWYLCGIEEPDWTLVIDGSADTSWLIMPDIDDVHRIFDGGLTADDAKTISGVTKVITATGGIELLRRLAKKHSLVYALNQPVHTEHFNFALNPSTIRNWSVLERTFNMVQDCRKELAILRSIKQADELKMIEKAVRVTVDAFLRLHDRFSTYKNEYEIEADFGRDIRYHGASGCAYDSIVAAGINACTLHYSKNHDAIRSRQLVLMDMGAQYGGYAADITRTYVKGEATKRQREIHATVEQAHHRIVGCIKPLLSIADYQRQVDEIMTDALKQLNLYKDESSLRRYFPHAISHGLGIDVHDSLGSPHHFKENMVLTVEPGIYVPEEQIGVRIEDDILITSDGHRNLSARLSTGL